MSRFVIGPSFAEQELAGISFMLTSFPDMTDAVPNGLFACSGRFFALLEEDNRSKKEDRNEDYRYSAKAVKELRKRGETKANSSPRGMADLTLAMSLALGIITFDLLDSGLHAHSICRYALGLISSGTYSEAVTRGGGLGRQMLPLIHMDTCNCLVRREIPMYRLQSGGGGKRGSDGVDHYIGRCVSLFSILYDVCCVNQKLKLGSREGHDIARRQENFEELAQVEAAVRDWSAELNEEDTTRLTLREIEVITTQAPVHRKAILLFIHRLRFPFGTEDDAATHMAAAVLDDIANLYYCSGGSGEGADRCRLNTEWRCRFSSPWLSCKILSKRPGH